MPVNKAVSNTNIFCIIGKPGSGRKTILKNIFNRSKFIDKYDINRFVYGTTKNMSPDDIDGETYHFMSQEDFNNLDPEQIIESRSYDPIFDDPFEYFTLVSHIKLGNNYIGRVSPFQYAELKKWASKMQIKLPLTQINIYPIIVYSPIFVREKRLMNQASSEEDVYTICSKLITERYEFNTVTKENPEITDQMNPNTLHIDNSKTNKSNIVLVCNDIEKFIEKKIILQGM